MTNLDFTIDADRVKRFALHLALAAAAAGLTYAGSHIGDLGLPAWAVGGIGVLIGSAASFVRQKEQDA